MSPRIAVAIAASANLAGAFVTTAVATTIGQGIIDTGLATEQTIASALLGAISWNLLTWWLGLPSSSSHALIGGLVGAAIVGLGFSAVSWNTVFTKMIIPLVVSPIAGFILAYIGMLVVFWALRHTRPQPANRGFRFAQIFSAAFVAFSHGTNDAQKTMGIIALALIDGGSLNAAQVDAGQIPLWVVASAAT